MSSAATSGSGAAAWDGSPPSAHGPRRTHRLGDALVEQRAITAEQLDWALEAHHRTGERLGRILLSAGLVDRRTVYRTLARAWHLPFRDLQQEPADALLAGLFDRDVLIREGWMPLEVVGRTLLVATCEEPSTAHGRVIVWRARALGIDVSSVRFVGTTEWDIRNEVRRIFRAQIQRTASYQLEERETGLSASSSLVLWQRLALVVAGGLLLIGLALETHAVVQGTVVALSVAFLISVVFKLVVCLAGQLSLRHAAVDDVKRHRIPDKDLPRYTVLVPVFREANVVGGLIEHLREIDYPPEKLEILLLMEEGDTETIDAARAARPPDIVQFILIPEGTPQTKPRACNVGLLFTSGQYLVIYDAEDLPEPDQLREAVHAFRAGDAELAVVQGRLNYFNAYENVLTRMFTLEYSYWFDYMLPGLDRLRLPIPLGGTSNHFRVDRLRELGGWDAFNVTEDADLGLRASALGYTVGIIHSTTWEEACSRVRPWIRQRTRWIKGYMQTALVHTRQPFRFARHAGVRGTIGLALLVAGTPFTFLASPILWLFTLIWVAGLSDNLHTAELFPEPIDTIALTCFLGGNFSIVALSALAVLRRRLYRLAPFALLAPFYWVLHSWAAWRALHQLITNPSYWEKTPHGLSQVSASAGVVGRPAAVAGPGESVPVKAA
ncbi:MAG: glycosyltransferase [Gaiellales bacterium]